MNDKIDEIRIAKQQWESSLEYKNDPYADENITTINFVEDLEQQEDNRIEAVRNLTKKILYFYYFFDFDFVQFFVSRFDAW